MSSASTTASGRSLIVRSARPDEAAALTDLTMRSKQSNGYDDDFMALCAAELRVTPERIAQGHFWVAEAEYLLGCASLRMTGTGTAASGEVETLFVAPGAQRHGVGRALWRRIVKAAEAGEMKHLHLDADPAALPFYQSLGFVRLHDVPSGSIPGRTIPRLVYTLTR